MQHAFLDLESIGAAGDEDDWALGHALMRMLVSEERVARFSC